MFVSSSQRFFTARNLHLFFFVSSLLSSTTSRASTFPCGQTLFSSSSSSSYSQMSAQTPNITLLNQEQSQRIDEQLMGEKMGFATEQLMELAGFSVAQAAYDFQQDIPHSRGLLVVSGPGFNGGDGLVAARHLALWDCFEEIRVVYPKPSKHPFLISLVKQLATMDIPVDDELPSNQEIEKNYSLIIDGVFGFSFNASANLRAPFDSVLGQLRTLNEKQVKVPILSIDVPSGWHVEQGDINQTGLLPQALISLTLPKMCSSKFHGVHYVGGRFVPPSFAKEMNLTLPQYQGTSQIVKLSSKI